MLLRVNLAGAEQTQDAFDFMGLGISNGSPMVEKPARALPKS